MDNKEKQTKEDFLKSHVIQNDMHDIFDRDVNWEKYYNKTILISGSTGMLASYLTMYLIWLNEEKKANIRILNLIRNEKKAEKIFGMYFEKSYFNLILQDINEPIKIDEKIDFIIHAASLASPQYYDTKPVEVIIPNTIGTYHLLNLAREKKIEGFLFFSSGDVYGKVDSIGIDKVTEDDFGITDPIADHSCYNEGKRLGEALCRAYYKEYGIPSKIVRIGHTYGPTMDINNDPRVFASFMKCVVNRENIVMYSDGSSRRPFCYITDAVSAFLNVLLNGNSGEAYNVVNTAEYLSIREFGEILCSLEPENNLRVVCKERPREDNYLENKTITEVPIVNDKLLNLGSEFKISVKEGFGRVLKYFEEGK